MNQTKNGLSKAHGAHYLHCQQACKPQPHRPDVMQPKGGMPAQKKQPLAPHVHRPQLAQKSVQPKMVSPAQPNRKQPVAPAVYRPQPVPKVLQTKMAGGQPSHSTQSPRQLTAPPRLTIQPKILSSARGSGVIQRNCGTPGCNDPNCTDPNNHGHARVFGLRGRNVYSGNVTAADIGTGTGTSQGTRNYVNSATTPYPQEIRIERSSGASGGYSSFTNEPLAPGQRADAGHIFGRQYGGFGNQNASVFPQHPQTNRGNSYQGQPTRDLWRVHEDAIRADAQSGNPTDVSVALHSTPRPIIRACPSCHRNTFTSATLCPYCGAFLP